MISNSQMTCLLTAMQNNLWLVALLLSTVDRCANTVADTAHTDTLPKFKGHYTVSQKKTVKIVFVITLSNFH